MLNIIYTSLQLAIIILAVIYLILIIVLMIKKSYNNVASIKVRIVLSSIQCALCIINIILAIMLGKSIVIQIVCAILWAIYMITGFLSLKDAQNTTPDSEFYIFINSGFKKNEDVIAVDFREVKDIDER